MPVDPTAIRRVLVVHGVQTGTDADQHQDQAITTLIRSRLNGRPLKFETAMYRYEDINDKAQNLLGYFLKALSSNVVLGQVAGFSLDLVGDVVISLQNDATAARIRAGLRETILDTHRAGNPLYLVAHSLGTIYAVDVVNELMQDSAYFDRNDRTTWPVQGLLTMGSPIGLGMFKRTAVRNLRAGEHYFRWFNYWSRTDPVVTGSFYGQPQAGYRIAENFHAGPATSGWTIQDRVVDMGKVWLAAHSAYWGHAPIGDDLVTLVAN